MKKLLVCFIAGLLAVCFGGCDEKPVENSINSVAEQSDISIPERNYLVLVNRTNKLPEHYEKSVNIIDGKNFFGGAFRIEEETYEHFLELREKMLMQEVQIEINRAYLDADEQKDLIEEYTNEYGEEYAYNYQGEPNYSENQTGLGIDICLYFAGEKIDTDKELMQTEAILKEIHSVMADYGFILRYPEEKVQTTDFMYQPWHIRYVGEEVAKEIYEKDITLEEYLENS